jgi:hypothetical protein
MEHRTTDDLIRIAASGAGFILDAKARLTDDLIRIAHAGAAKGSRLLFRGVASRLTDDLIKIGQAGQGCVTFE